MRRNNYDREGNVKVQIEAECSSRLYNTPWTRFSVPWGGHWRCWGPGSPCLPQTLAWWIILSFDSRSDFATQSSGALCSPYRCVWLTIFFTLPYFLGIWHFSSSWERPNQRCQASSNPTPPPPPTPTPKSPPFCPIPHRANTHPLLF